MILVVSVVLVVVIIVGCLLQWPTESQRGARAVFEQSTKVFGATVQLIGLACAALAGYLAVSRYGDIKFGEGAPRYSTSSWLFMFLSAGLGSATMYWSFVEWAYYYQTPGLNLPPQTPDALAISLAYAFFHWGPIPWAMYAVAGTAMAYYFHVRKGQRLSFAGNVEAISGNRVKADSIAGRIIDLLFLFATFGGLILTVTLTVNTAAAGLAGLAGRENTFGFKAVILAASTAVFGLSSYIGIDKGLQKLAKVAALASLAFALVVFVIGPTQFIVDNTVNAMGLELQNFFHMALFTDPLGTGSFPRNWTVFYWLYWISYLPGVAVFIARVSEGRTIRQTICGLLFAGCAGIMLFFGVLSNYAIDQMNRGGVNAVALLTSRGGDVAVAQLLSALPLGHMFSLIYFLIMLVFLASHLDATAFTIAAVSTRDMPHGTDPARGFRLFWVILLAAIPTAMLAIHANLDTLKTGLTLTAIPFAALLVVQMIGLMTWLKQDVPPLTVVESKRAG
jgi:BCCT family betaine/carnitine transporter